MNLAAAIKALLKADATLATYTTNILDHEDVGIDGLTLNNIKHAAQSKVKPSIYLAWTEEVPYSVTVINARRAMLDVYFYDDKSASNRATLSAMRRRVYALLHQQRVTIDAPDYHYAALWRGDVLIPGFDPALGGALMERTTFENHYVRRTS